MANRLLFFGLGCLALACGGRASINSGAVGQGGGFGTAGAVGSAGSVAAGGAAAAGAAATAGTAALGGAPAKGGASVAGAAGSGAGAGGIDWAACAPPDTCVLETQTACGAGCEPVPLSRYIPVNSKNEAAYKMQQLVPPCVSGGCLNVPPSMVNSPNYYAACEAGRCQGVDIRASALSACSSGSDCSLRPGNCCGCGTANIIAVSNPAALEAAFCGANASCSADCVSVPPPLSVTAYCSSGHCLVKYPDSVSDAGPAP